MGFRWNRGAVAVLFTAMALGASGIGCDTDRPTGYGQQRPPVDELDPRDRGLQSSDVLKASDKITAGLLALPELRQSDRRWSVVVSHVEDNTSDRKFEGVDFQIFLERLRANLSQQGRGLIRLVENKDRFYDIRGRELEGEREGNNSAAPAAASPDFGLYLTANDLPNRGTTFYQINFVVTDLRTREQVYVGDYSVKVARERP